MSNLNNAASSPPGSNGADVPGSQTPDPQANRREDGSVGITDKMRLQAASLQNAVAFTQAIGVLMRSSNYRQYTIGDLEWLLVPAIANRQFRLAEAKLTDAKGGSTLPVGLVLWAFVSPDIDKRLMETKTGAPKLEPADWTSGDIPWLVHAAGEVRFVRPIVEQLMKTTFRDRKVKVLGRDQGNNVRIHVLETSADAASTN